MKKSLPAWLCSLVCGTLLLVGCQKNEELDPTIAGIAVANPDFQILEDAAIRGEVVDILSNKNPNDPEGNYTVFAPTNAAFARLGLTSAADLLALQKPFLTATLFYHVTGGTLAGSALQPGLVSPSALGPGRRIIRRGSSTYVNGSKILATDVQASNGTVHAIDKVLLATGSDIVQSAVALKDAQVFTRPELSFLVEAVLYCNLQGVLTASPGSPQFTVFAPTDQAFKNLGTDLGVALDVPADIRKLPQATVTAVLLNHVVPGSQFTSELPENARVTTAGGGQLMLGAFTEGTLTVKGTGNASAAGMVIPDVQCTNGIVHVIDRVLLP
ncbi:fasciclin domain-containing protein [Hymenobacter psychrotolerans]|uniref:Uncaracterized surface protein containing fasciclin (FAS1) repeats n=1 Tax=Hymenobacter psychrotolerans DSM 18569 TaxID=1121959 RepID=A0A1M6WSS0_9BACT|nr:fasciclin domain-containing protein [Hymenobacter psychrotolerans]SHK96768.1 Uncaracterized surface protein containing fasciclin (FAS1) repeats [Hymenobacter psychrotolerans DSM 18569]